MQDCRRHEAGQKHRCLQVGLGFCDRVGGGNGEECQHALRLSSQAISKNKIRFFGKGER